MSRRGSVLRAAASPLGVLALLAVAAIAARLAMLPGRGFPSDVDEIVRWAHRIASTGPSEMYRDGPQGVNYPALLYVLWPLASWWDGDALRLAIKGLSIPFDIAIGALLYVVAGAGSRWRGVFAAGLYWADPATLIAGPFWGQVDAAGTLPFLAALISAGKRRWLVAGVLVAVAALVKPQFGAAGVVVLAAAGLELIQTRSIRALLGVAAGGLVAFAVIAVPLRLTIPLALQMVMEASNPWPYTSLYAFNPWGLLIGFIKPDTAYFATGAVLLALGLGLSLVPLWWRRDVAALLAVGTFVVFAFYFLPTRVHERYLFPALATLAPSAAGSRRLLVPYLGIALAFTLSLLYMLADNADATSVHVPLLVQNTLFSHTGVLSIGLVLIGSSLATIWLLLTGETSVIKRANTSL